MNREVRTQVAIVGAGPAGLLLGRMLSRAGIDNAIFERRDRAYCEARIRAGVLEQGTVDLLAELGVDARLRREGLVHGGIELRWGRAEDRHAYRVAMDDLTGGRTVTIYGQTEIVKDLIAARVASGEPLSFETEVTAIEGFLDVAERPRLTVRTDAGECMVVSCDLVVAADGFHGIGRRSVPAERMTTFQRRYPFAWLGVLAQTPPSCDELIYAHHDDGFAMHSMRSPEISRLYLQVEPDDDVANWSDDRIWEALATRMQLNGWHLTSGPILEKSITPMRSYVTEPMRHGRLFLAGDAAHIVPPTGAKGLNLAASDVRVLGTAIEAGIMQGDLGLLDAYSDTCLRRIWRAEDFSFWMTSLLHRTPDDTDGFTAQLQRSRLRYVSTSEAAARSLAENYVGMDAV